MFVNGFLTQSLVKLVYVGATFSIYISGCLGILYFGQLVGILSLVSRYRCFFPLTGLWIFVGSLLLCNGQAAQRGLRHGLNLGRDLINASFKFGVPLEAF